ncbi:MAG: HAMP domain-containing histidine kinase [Bifidobacteriaceae bacterium]|jgi:signal transduction histidine kinase|nr:HAMP domain-containing histidine kinase [Bifidobacteriaceae bacterium]
MWLKPIEVDAIIALANGQTEFDFSINAHDSNTKRAELFNALGSIARQFESRDRTIKDLIANVSHELRTPVTAIRAMAENLVDEVTPPTESAFQQILSQSEKLSKLIEFMLDTTRIESGVTDLIITEFSVMNFLHECAEPLTLLQPTKHLQFLVNVFPKNLLIKADRDRLAQMMTNLITNSIKYAPPDSEVLLNAYRDQKQIIFEVADHGPGVDPKLKDRLFHRFETSAGDDHGGTGIGLSIARWAAQLHGGTVNLVDSKVGAVFEVRLPN